MSGAASSQTATGGSSDSLLLNETFTISNCNAAKYDRVSRISGSSSDLNFHFDINHDLYPVDVGDTIEIQLTTTLSLDGTSDLEKAKLGWKDVDEGGTLADGWDYVVYGKVYRFEESGAESVKVFASFGGLLFYLEGSAKKLMTLKHEYIYLLMRKA